MGRIQIYTFGGGGGGGEPGGGGGGGLWQALCGFAAAAAAVAFGIFMLPVAGFIVLVIIGVVLALVAASWIYRKIHGDPLEQFMKSMAEQQRAARSQGANASAQDETESGYAPESGTMRWKGRKVEVEDAVEKQ